MRILGVISILSGLGLLALFGYGMSEEIRRGTAFGSAGTLIAFALLISGFCICWFAARTLRHDVVGTAHLTESQLLDLPEHIREEENRHAVSPFTLACGYVSFISSLLLLLYAVFGIYQIVQFISYGGSLSPEFIIIFLVFSGALCTLIYCIRKLFFSRKRF